MFGDSIHREIVARSGVLLTFLAEARGSKAIDGSTATVVLVHGTFGNQSTCGLMQTRQSRRWWRPSGRSSEAPRIEIRAAVL